MRADPLLVETVERMFAENLAPEDLAEAHRGGGARFMALAREMGLDAVLVPQEEGGYGGGWPDAFVIAEACGRYAAPGALPEAMIRRAPGAAGGVGGCRGRPVPLADAGRSAAPLGADGGRGAGPYGAHRRLLFGAQAVRTPDREVPGGAAADGRTGGIRGLHAGRVAAGLCGSAEARHAGVRRRAPRGWRSPSPSAAARNSCIGSRGSRMGCMGRSGSPRRWGCSTSVFRCGAGARNMGAIPTGHGRSERAPSLRVRARPGRPLRARPHCFLVFCPPFLSRRRHPWLGSAVLLLRSRKGRADRRL